MAHGTTWGTRSDTAVSQVLYWKDTVPSHVLYHLAVEHSGTFHHHFVEVGWSFFLSIKKLIVGVMGIEGPKHEVTGQRMMRSPSALIREPDGAQILQAKPL